MNDKENELYRILDVTISCCTFEDFPITRDDVLDKSRKQNIVMTRCMVAMNILAFGYSVNTCAMFLHRTEHAVREMVSNAQNLLVTSRAFEIARKQSMKILKENQDE